eukprot:Pgem_evm1s13156
MLLGNYAYVDVVRQLRDQGARYRLVALSATPGNSLETVQNLVSNLEITHLELKSEESEDIKEYVFGRDMEVVIVNGGKQIDNIK